MTETERQDQIYRIKNAIRDLAFIVKDIKGDGGLLIFERLEKDLKELQALEPTESTKARLLAYG